ncbi:hypothetical protein [Xenorhabdus siamensis]|uniref:hypothetical protein n=1 Tax=Xenorhabdus siamensis TaxID=3136254 RepID=UPI0030F3EB97
MSVLTLKEKEWLDQLQKVLDECPSERLGFYTVGDNYLSSYDLTHYEEISKQVNETGKSWSRVVYELQAEFSYFLKFPAPVDNAKE